MPSSLKTALIITLVVGSGFVRAESDSTRAVLQSIARQVQVSAELYDIGASESPRLRALANRLGIPQTVSVLEAPVLDHGGAEYSDGVIRLDQRYRAYKDIDVAFVIAHEYGHHLQRSLRTFDKVPQAQLELDADATAMVMLRRKGFLDQPQQVSLFDRPQASSSTHPSHAERQAQVLSFAK
jgi:hypothetical protein